MINALQITAEEKWAVDQIAQMYWEEWKIPTEHTWNNFKSDNIILQLALVQNEKIIATGGWYKKVNIHHFSSEWNQQIPWLALMKVNYEKRGSGLGSALLNYLEYSAQQLGFNKTYLFTRDTEQFYLKHKWTISNEVEVNQKKIILMEKVFDQSLSKPSFDKIHW